MRDEEAEMSSPWAPRLAGGWGALRLADGVATQHTEGTTDSKTHAEEKGSPGWAVWPIHQDHMALCKSCVARSSAGQAAWLASEKGREESARTHARLPGLQLRVCWANVQAQSPHTRVRFTEPHHHSHKKSAAPLRAVRQRQSMPPVSPLFLVAKKVR